MDYMCHSARDLSVKLLMGFNSFFIQIHFIKWKFSCSVLSIWFVKGFKIAFEKIINLMLQFNCNYTPLLLNCFDFTF